MTTASLSNMIYRLSFTVFTDSKWIFHTIIKLSSVTEKRLLYATGEIQNFGQILSEFNIVDALNQWIGHTELPTIEEEE